MVDFSRLHEKRYRMDNFYSIVDKQGHSIPFRMTDVQADVFENMHTRNIVLKARQLGMSTFSVLYLLDEVLFNRNFSAGIVSYSLQHAGHIFKRIIGHALANLPAELGNGGVIQQSSKEITTDAGSMLRVDTSLRGGTYQGVLVSEFGKTCARSPLKAEEIVTGTLNALSQDCVAIIESTGEGIEGYFADMCLEANSRDDSEELSNLDWKLFFYPWFIEPSYSMKKPIRYGIELADYFSDLKTEGVVDLTEEQKYWYTVQEATLNEKVRQEYPSTVSEAFLSNSDAYYFAEYVQRAWDDNRVLNSNPFEPLAPVYAAMDIGVNDQTVIIIFQVIHGEIRVLDIIDGMNKGAEHYANHMMHESKYHFSKIFLPHDAKRRDGVIVENTSEREFKKLFSHTETQVVVLKRNDRNAGIAHAKTKFDRCVFNLKRTKTLLENLSKYRKKWSEATGRYLDEPYHDERCFVGETKISTPFGQRRIDEIKEGDFVCTPNGNKKVLRCFQYQASELLDIQTTMSSFRCTPQHKIFSEKGLVRADALGYGDQLYTECEMQKWNIRYRGRENCLGFRDYFLSLNQEMRCSLTGTSTKKMNLDTFSEKFLEQEDPNRYTGQYGNFTTAQSQKALTSTMWTKTKETTLSRISSVLKGLNTSDYTCRIRNAPKSLVKALKRRKNTPESGTDQNQVESGISNMEKKCLQKERVLKNHVLSATSNMSRFGLDQNTVLTSARQERGICQEKTMRSGNATIAKKNLPVTNTLKRNHVVRSVPVLLETKQNVYDIEVEDDHCYYANTILVSNSDWADAFRYMCEAVSHIEAAKNRNDAFENHRRAVESRNRRVI